MKIIETNVKFKSKLKKLKDPSMIVIHHAAHSSATVLEAHRWHLENRWSGFRYHFLVTKVGKVSEKGFKALIGIMSVSM